MAVYIRLSREDGNDESLSVENQRKIIGTFLEEAFQGAWTLAGEFVDDGVTGTGAERPGFQRMLRAIEEGRVNCVVCKTLSRAFRNYADQGYFLESYFPRFGVRFISLGGPAVDSYLRPEAICGYEVPISGIMNDRYACRTSADVRNTLNMKRRRGEFIGAFAPYGYQKDMNCKGKLVIDKTAAEVVRNIFLWRAENVSCQEIARRLNFQGILAPSAYKRQSGLRYQNPKLEASRGLWSARTISQMLNNPVYIGTMVQGRQRVVSYKIHDRKAVGPEEWFVVEHTHPPIVDRELFDQVNSLVQGKVKGKNSSQTRHLLSGLVYCGHCGQRMGRKTAKGHSYFACRRREGMECPGSSIREDQLEELICGLWEKLEEQDKGNYSVQRTQEEQLLRQKQKELERLKRIGDTLYLDWRTQVISDEEYGRVRQRWKERVQKLECWCEQQGIYGQEEVKKQPDILERSNLVRFVRGIVIGQKGEVALYLCAQNERREGSN